MGPNNPEWLARILNADARNPDLQLDRFQLATRYSLLVTDYRVLNTLTPKAANIPFALAMVSRYSDSGSLSATMPLPAWT